MAVVRGRFDPSPRRSRGVRPRPASTTRKPNLTRPAHGKPALACWVTRGWCSGGCRIVSTIWAMSTVGCIACDLAEGRAPLPGGLINATAWWRIEHCVGPLGVGTLILNPTRHVVHLADLAHQEADELGPLLRRASACVTALCSPDQVYACLWSHGPAHLHFVIQPVGTGALHGPRLQADLFAADVRPDASEVEEFAERARSWFATG